MSLGLFPPSWGRVLRNTEMLESKRISSHTVELLLPADPLDTKYKVRIQARPQGELPRAAEPAALAPGGQQDRSLRPRNPHQLLFRELRELSGCDCAFEPGL